MRVRHRRAYVRDWPSARGGHISCSRARWTGVSWSSFSQLVTHWLSNNMKWRPFGSPKQTWVPVVWSRHVLTTPSARASAHTKRHLCACAGLASRQARGCAFPAASWTRAGSGRSWPCRSRRWRRNCWTKATRWRAKLCRDRNARWRPVQTRPTRGSSKPRTRPPPARWCAMPCAAFWPSGRESARTARGSCATAPALPYRCARSRRRSPETAPRSILTPRMRKTLADPSACRPRNGSYRRPKTASTCWRLQRRCDARWRYERTCRRRRSRRNARSSPHTSCTWKRSVSVRWGRRLVCSRRGGCLRRLKWLSISRVESPACRLPDRLPPERRSCSWAGSVALVSGTPPGWPAHSPRSLTERTRSLRLLEQLHRPGLWVCRFPTGRNFERHLQYLCLSPSASLQDFCPKTSSRLESQVSSWSFLRFFCLLLLVVRRGLQGCLRKSLAIWPFS